VWYRNLSVTTETATIDPEAALDPPKTGDCDPPDDLIDMMMTVTVKIVITVTEQRVRILYTIRIATPECRK
jgi:hypothetical protein